MSLVNSGHVPKVPTLPSYPCSEVGVGLVNFLMLGMM